MKILHTADWHLGKKLENKSLLESQKLVLKQIIDHCQTNEIDVVLIAGDIYDSSFPSGQAETLFYETIYQLTGNQERIVIIISGNHDSSLKLAATNPLARQLGIIIISKCYEVVELGKIGKGKIVEAYPGMFLLEKNNDQAYFYCLPYPSEADLGIDLSDDDKTLYSNTITSHMKEQLAQTKEIPTIGMAHLFINMSDITKEDERDIELGGAKGVNKSDLPQFDYLALGHFHKPMKVNDRCFYSGSILEYRISEASYQKQVKVYDTLTKTIENINLINPKPLKKVVYESFEAIDFNLFNQNYYFYLIINTNRSLTGLEIKQLKQFENIISIEIILSTSNQSIISNSLNQSIEEEFSDYYQKVKGNELSKSLLVKFKAYLNEVEEIDDASH